MLRRQEKDRRWRSNYKRLEREVNSIEEDEYQLERVYPQGEDGETRWVLFILGFWLTGFMGIIGIVLSLAWICQICLYMLPLKGPVSPMLNAAFVLLDNAFALLGVIFFSIFCLYLMGKLMQYNAGD
jgi:LMBR1 domain-containing protein 1